MCCGGQYIPGPMLGGGGIHTHSGIPTQVPSLVYTHPRDTPWKGPGTSNAPLKDHGTRLTHPLDGT